MYMIIGCFFLQTSKKKLLKNVLAIIYSNCSTHYQTEDVPKVCLKKKTLELMVSGLRIPLTHMSCSYILYVLYF